MKCELLLLRHFMLTASILTSHFATLMKLNRWYFVIWCGLTLMSRPSFAFAKSAAQTKSATSAKSTAQFKRSPASVTITPTGEIEASLRARITKNSDDIDARVKLGQILEKKQAWKELIELQEAHVSSLPRAGLMPIAKAYEMRNDNLNEIRILMLCMAKDAKDFYCKTAQAQVLVRMKKNDEAIEAYSAAKEMNPKFEPAYTGLMKQLEASGYNYEARDLLADMKKKFGDRPSYQSDLCRLYSKDAFLEKTVEACDQAIATDKKNPLNFTYLATSLKEQESPEKAIAVLKKGLAKFPKAVPILVALGKTEVEQKKFTDALREYKVAVGADPKSVDAWVGYGIVSIELQKFDEALTAFDKAFRLDRHAVGDFRTASKRLRDLKASSWQRKFEDHIYQCAPVY